MSIVVIDYGMGNLASVAKAMQHVAPDQTVLISSDEQTIRSANRVVLPGQGAMPECMRFLRESGLQHTVMWAAHNLPMLGVCVGEQMLMQLSDEGATQGLSLFEGKVVRFADAMPHEGHDGGAPRLKVPHMGWNRVHQTQPHPLWQGIADHSYFYFVHSYYAQPVHAQHSVAVSDYGVRFTCAIARDNIFATQFHPEKSASAGLQLYQNFTRWNP